MAATARHAAVGAAVGAAVAAAAWWRARLRLAAAASEAEEAAEEIAALRTALGRLARQQTHVLSRVPPEAAAHVPNRGWSKCAASIDAVDAGYEAARTRRRRKTDGAPAEHGQRSTGSAAAAASGRVLMSSFDLERGGGEEKARVDALLAGHVAAHLPNLAERLRRDASLLLLLLEAPSCATTAALARAVPALRGLGGRICIPQADPGHYDLMVNLPARGVPPMLNVRSQRLDAWLSSSAGLGLRAAVFFADYETSVYGKVSAQLSPLRDLQRFFRGGFAADRCLVGVTLSFRAANRARYDGPQLEPADLHEFVAVEAAAQGLRCVLLEELRYGMTFQLWLVSRDGQ